MNRSILSIILASVLGVLVFASSAPAQTFSSGATGAQGAFPPASFSSLSYDTLTVDLKTGVVTALTGATVKGTATLPGGATSGDAFPTGDLDFSTVALLNSSATLKFLPNSMNTPVTIRTTGDVTIYSTINLKGGDGQSSNAYFSIAGKGNVGGGNGGQGGLAATTQSPETAGSSGLGRNGGAGGIVGSSGAESNGQGGAFPSTNLNLQPLVGGSGGGGGRGATSGGDGLVGASGGGGGGAILIGSSTKISVGNVIDASGGAGGNGGCSSGYARGGGGGSGGAIRLISNRIELGGFFVADGGTSACSAAPGGPGVIQIEAYDLSIQNQACCLNPNSARPTFGQPGTIRPSNIPRLRISSIGGTAVPDTTAGITGAIEVQLPANTSNPMAVVLAATSIPDGTGVTVSMKPLSGVETTASGTLSNAAATVNLTIPTGTTNLQAYTGTFTLSADLQNTLPLFNGERILKASVEFDGERDHTYFFTASGKRVSAETLLAAR